MGVVIMSNTQRMFEQRPGGSEGGNCVMPWERMFQAEGTVNAERDPEACEGCKGKGVSTPVGLRCSEQGE